MTLRSIRDFNFSADYLVKAAVMFGAGGSVFCKNDF